MSEVFSDQELLRAAWALNFKRETELRGAFRPISTKIIDLVMAAALLNSVYDCIVVGAGIEGCSTAYQLAKNGHSTLLLEQFPLPHNRGSSHGQTRIIRYSYGQKHFSDMMLEAYPMWMELEKEANTTLYSKTGVFQLEEPPYKDYNNHLKCLQSIDKPYRLFTGQDINREFPGVRYAGHYKGMLELDGGVLMANKCLQSYQNQFVKFGGTLQDGEKVLHIQPGTHVTIVTNKGKYLSKSVVLTPGPWASQLLQPLGIKLPLQPQRVNVCYWKEKTPGTYATYPCLMDLSTSKYGAGMYALPSTDYPGLMKVCYLHTGKNVDNADHRDYARIGKQKDIDTMREYIKDHFPGLHREQPAILETCMFTSTPDGDPVIDRHPSYPNIIFAVGMSGHGFKLAPVFGKIMCEMATNQPLSYDITPVSMKRYSNAKTFSKL